LQRGQDPMPDAVPLPAAEQVVHPTPRPVPLRHVPPRNTRAVRNRIPLMSCRFVHVAGRPGFLPLGNSGASTAHCASVRSPRATNRDHLTPKIYFRNTP
jgi:hypothetical protein